MLRETAHIRIRGTERNAFGLCESRGLLCRPHRTSGRPGGHVGYAQVGVFIDVRVIAAYDGGRIADVVTQLAFLPVAIRHPDPQHRHAGRGDQREKLAARPPHRGPLHAVARAVGVYVRPVVDGGDVRGRGVCLFFLSVLVFFCVFSARSLAIPPLNAFFVCFFCLHPPSSFPPPQSPFANNGRAAAGQGMNGKRCFCYFFSMLSGYAFGTFPSAIAAILDALRSGVFLLASSNDDNASGLLPFVFVFVFVFVFF